mgnify:CR=1 FL=1
MFKFIKNVVIRSIVISAVVAGLSYGSYWICKALAWATTNLTTLLTQLGTYVKANVPVLITIIVLVTIANVVYELIAGRVKNGTSGRSKWRKKASKAEESK